MYTLWEGVKKVEKGGFYKGYVLISKFVVIYGYDNYNYTIIHYYLIQVKNNN